MLTDNSGYLITGSSLTGYTKIWKYLYSSPYSTEWQEISTIYQYPHAQLMLSNSELFIAGDEPSPNYHLRFFKFTFGNSYVDWGKKILWPTPSCIMAASDGLVSNNIIYSIFSSSYGAEYAFLVWFSALDGTIIGSIYKSVITCTDVDGSAINGNYVIFVAYCMSTSYLVLFDISSSLLTTKVFNGASLLGWSVEKTTER